MLTCWPRSGGKKRFAILQMFQLCRAEFTIGLMLALLRQVPLASTQMQCGIWQRHFGRRLGACTVGIIGAGRIGGRVIQHLQSFGPPRIMVNDISPEPTLGSRYPLQWASKEEIYREADVITLHLPLTAITCNLIRREELLMMKPDAILINSARAGIINEPELAGIDWCLLTALMGSMSVDCRTRMEIEATQEAVRFVSGQRLLSPVPSEEYEVQRKSE